jgi:hypothetical protein
MSTSGETAEQVVRKTLNGVEVAAKLTGAAPNRSPSAQRDPEDHKRTKGKIRCPPCRRSGKNCGIRRAG